MWWMFASCDNVMKISFMWEFDEGLFHVLTFTVSAVSSVHRKALCESRPVFCVRCCVFLGNTDRNFAPASCQPPQGAPPITHNRTYPPRTRSLCFGAKLTPAQDFGGVLTMHRATLAKLTLTRAWRNYRTQFAIPRPSYGNMLFVIFRLGSVSAWPSASSIRPDSHFVWCESYTFRCFCARNRLVGSHFEVRPSSETHLRHPTEAPQYRTNCHRHFSVVADGSCFYLLDRQAHLKQVERFSRWHARRPGIVVCLGRLVASFWGLGGQDFCFYYMFKINIIKYKSIP